ncbi:PepSY-associated TM helix domain-containing protein [Sphingobium bisphenolivorans]|uniref:PepSY-associated TM helix domain-containing protein n=1 Tax=Sphingobium bisphenolivorans TaxID=1335760 RepID=UPI0003A59F2C|nr:PepSY-associated TM helix domain-containing protein [Sphingobium bisphenolivorans]
MSRVQWLRVHKYVGLAMAALLLVQALTGMLLLYRGPVARLVDPAGMTSQGAGPATPPGMAVMRAEQALPGFSVVRLFAPDVEGATYVAEMANGAGEKRYASIDPAGGALLRAGTIWAFPVEAALQIHYRLMAGKVGMALVLLNALALLTMAATGLAYWWPRRGPVSKHLSIRWSIAFRLVLRQLHRTLGVVASALLGFMAVTGLLLIVPEIVAADGPPALHAASSATRIEQSLRMAQSAFPNIRLRDFRLAGGQLIVNFNAPERNPRAVHRAIVTIAEPHIVSATRAENSTALWMTVLPLHGGNSFGAVGPMVLMIVAVILAALAISGPLMWWQAKSLRRRSTTRKQIA